MPSLQSVDVVVIGAGISGLSVADQLIRAGRSVTLLEARARTGGRLFGSPFDLGASWFWPGEYRVRALVQRLGIETFDQYRDGNAIVDDLSGVHVYPGNPIDVPAHRVVGGTSSLAKAITDSLPPGVLQLDQPVKEITADLSVVSRDQVIHAEHVVIAVPPALAVQSIALPTGLPQKIIDVASQTPVWMGDSVKVVAHFSESFWRRDGFAGAAISRRGPLVEIHDMSGPEGEPAALFGFARPASMVPDIERDIREQLVRMFGPQASAPIEVLIQNWNLEKWTTPSQSSDNSNFSMFGHPIYREPSFGGRLHWSTTETAERFAGHIEGALEAAERTVSAILA